MRNYFVFLAICFVAFFSFCEGGFEYKGKQGQENDLVINDSEDDVIFQTETYGEDVFETDTNSFINPAPIDPTLEQLYGNLDYNQEEKDFFGKIYEKTGIEFGKGGSYSYDQLIHSCHKNKDLKIDQTSLYYNIRFYVIRKNSKPAVENEKIDKDLAALNSVFKEIKLAFNQKQKVTYFDKPEFWNVNPKDTEEFNSLLKLHSPIDDSEYPVFYVGWLYGYAGAAYVANTSGAVIAGFTDYENKYALDFESDVVVHEVGHQFALFHTFNEFFEEEECDGSNCWEAADLVCDTPADRWKAFECKDKSPDWCKAECKKCSTPPDKHNFMSYYEYQCKDRFTMRQKAVMKCFLMSLIKK